MNDGYLSFSHPKFFNDPFNCNFLLENNSDMSEKIRVLCLTYEYDNILMWSYYSQSHKGYCFEFSHQNLINKIKSLIYQAYVFMRRLIIAQQDYFLKIKFLLFHIQI